jgi:mycothiol synthase
LHERGRVDGVIALDLRPVASPEFGSCTTIEQALAGPCADATTRKRLLDGATAFARDSGFSGVAIYVDSDDTLLVNACRLAGFQHDRTDVRYQLGGP